MTTATLTPPCYPARPINGGPLPAALPKHGDWYYEPKYNGWRALVHVPTGTMFNRHGQQLTIAGEFTAALAQIQETFPHNWWLDCEGLERRHQIGRGSLIVLDFVETGGSRPCRDRHLILRDVMLPRFEALAPEINATPNTLYLAYRVEAPFENDLWTDLLAENQRLGCDFYEGLVAKRADSPYPLQRHSPNKEFPFWVKHRWAW